MPETNAIQQQLDAMANHQAGQEWLTIADEIDRTLRQFQTDNGPSLYPREGTLCPSGDWRKVCINLIDPDNLSEFLRKFRNEWVAARARRISQDLAKEMIRKMFLKEAC